MSVIAWRHRAPSAAAVLDAGDTLAFVDPPQVRRIKRAAALTSLAVCLGYLVYRGLWTLNAEAPVFSVLLYVAECHGFLSLALYYHQSWALRRRDAPPAPPGLRVDVFVTTLDEDLSLVRQSLRGAIAMRYPHRTFVVDEGRRPEVQALAKELGAGYLPPDHRDATASGWNAAFRRTDADLIATFHADHVPRPAFLERTLGFFADPGVAFVQVPQQYHNLDSVQHHVNWRTRRMHGERDVFFDLVMPGKDHHNAAILCGTGAVVRRAALEKHGGLLTGTAGQDLHTSIVLHSEGWKSVYLNEVLVTGLAPMDLHEFEVQRLRRAEGHLATLAHVNPITCRGLTIGQRVSYVASLFHWTTGLPKLIFYLAPAWMLLSGTSPVARVDGTLALLCLGSVATAVLACEIVSLGRSWLLLDEVFSLAGVFATVRALERVVLGRGADVFPVTRWRGQAARLLPLTPQVALLAVNLLTFGWYWTVPAAGGLPVVAAAVASCWALHNAALVCLVLLQATRPPPPRAAPRFLARFPVERRGMAGVVGMTQDLSEGGCRLLWPEPLDVGALVGVRVHLGPAPLDLDAEVMSAEGRSRTGWHTHGLAFRGHTRAETDLINDALFQSVVPALFARLSEPWLPARIARRVRAWSRYQRLAGTRRQDTLPVRVTDSAGSFLAVTRDISSGGIGFVSPHPVAPGACVALEVLGPGLPRRLATLAVRCQPLVTDDRFPAWLIGVRVDRTAAIRLHLEHEESSESVA